MTDIIEPTSDAVSLYEAYLNAAVAMAHVDRRLSRANVRHILKVQFENTSSHSDVDVASTIAQLRRKVSAEDPDVGYINTWNAALDAVAAALADTPGESPDRHQPHRGDDVEIWLTKQADRRIERLTPDHEMIARAMETQMCLLRDHYINHADCGLPLITDEERRIKKSVDPVCAIHGKKWSEHEGGRCLYCCICFQPLTIDQCAVDSDGQKHDVCKGQCAIESGIAEKES